MVCLTHVYMADIKNLLVLLNAQEGKHPCSKRLPFLRKWEAEGKRFLHQLYILVSSARVAQNAPKVKNLQGDLFHSCFLPSWWEKCIETCKKLMARVCKEMPHLGPHLPYGYQGKNAIFWSRSFLTPLIAWKTLTNIGKQLCISQYPTRHPKSTKIELMDQILAL